MVNDFRNAAEDDVLDERVGLLLSAAAAPADPGPVPGEEAALAAFRAAQRSAGWAHEAGQPRAVRAGIAVAMSTGVLLAAGVSGAAAGALPGAAQDTASRWLAKVGVTVPGADERSAGHPGTRGSSGQGSGARLGEARRSDDGPLRQKPATTGNHVSDVARDPATTGQDRGAAVSGTASDGRSQAGQKDPLGPSRKPPAATPAEPASPARPARHGKPAAPAEPAGPAVTGDKGASDHAAPANPPAKDHAGPPVGTAAEHLPPDGPTPAGRGASGEEPGNGPETQP